jgi:hypothetical protein
MLSKLYNQTSTASNISSSKYILITEGPYTVRHHGCSISAIYRGMIDRDSHGLGLELGLWGWGVGVKMNESTREMEYHREETLFFFIRTSIHSGAILDLHQSSFSSPRLLALYCPPSSETKHILLLFSLRPAFWARNQNTKH